jgi:hypothetical protein
MGVAGQPNVVAILIMKAVSCALSHRHQVPHCAQSRRCACGPLLEPMIAIWLPQRQARGIRTFSPMMGEADDVAVSAADDDGEGVGKRSSCTDLASSDGDTVCACPHFGATFSLLPKRSPSCGVRGLGSRLRDDCPRPLRFMRRRRSPSGSRRLGRRAAQPQLVLASASTASARSRGSSRRVCP